MYVSLFYAGLVPAERVFSKVWLLQQASSSIPKASCKIFKGAGKFVIEIFGFLNVFFQVLSKSNEPSEDSYIGLADFFCFFFWKKS